MPETATIPADARHAPMWTAGPSDWSQASQAWDQTQIASELLGAWACAVVALGDYVQRLAASTTPLAVLDAGTRLMTDSLDICSRAAGARLRDGGVNAPLLNDA